MHGEIRNRPFDFVTIDGILLKQYRERCLFRSMSNFGGCGRYNVNTSDYHGMSGKRQFKCTCAFLLDGGHTPESSVPTLGRRWRTCIYSV